jgi:hypothetical protein
MAVERRDNREGLGVDPVDLPIQDEAKFVAHFTIHALEVARHNESLLIASETQNAFFSRYRFRNELKGVRVELAKQQSRRHIRQQPAALRTGNMRIGEAPVPKALPA